MNWLRSKLRAWLEDTAEEKATTPESGRFVINRRINGAFTLIAEQAKQAEHQQREICALRGEVAMLKADRDAQTEFARPRGTRDRSLGPFPISPAPKYEDLTGRNYAESNMTNGRNVQHEG